MTIDEKLQHFYEVSVEEAKEDAAKAIQENLFLRCWKIIKQPADKALRLR